ncbi:MAG: glycosyltransferase family 4 protein [Pseudomonadota bacterium]
MARLILQAMAMAGLEPRTASVLRVYLKTGDSELPRFQQEAAAEIEALMERYRSGKLQRPACWFTYHPYYKSPDLIGPVVARELGIPYVTAEASWSRKRASGAWARAHALNEAGLRSARLHLCLTARDRAGLEEFLGGEENLKSFPPFIDVSKIDAGAREDRGAVAGPVRLLTVGMMRQDVKLESYQMLAQVLEGMQDAPWLLDIVGDGEARRDVERAFQPIEQARLNWRGQLSQETLFRCYSKADIYVWPGFGEAFGMAYLEAQAAGLPVVAQDTKGVPSVVEQGRTGLLTQENDVAAFRAAVRLLIDTPAKRREMSGQAMKFVRDERSLEQAAARLHNLLGALL